MTLIAGVIARVPGEKLAPGTGAALREAISRHPGENPILYQDADAALCKVDLGVFDSDAYRVAESGSVTLLAGEPLLAGAGGSPTGRRADDVMRLQERLECDDLGVLREARGSFCAAHYDPSRHTLLLIADKLGLRPLYVWSDRRFVVFASALRILEALEFVPKIVDLRGVTEETAFGYPIGVRTPYVGIRVLYAGEALRFASDRQQITRYWRWDEIPALPGPESDVLDLARERFHGAVARRLHGSHAVRAFLSGGLDSRCVVAVLRGHGVAVDTYTFALGGSQDEVYAERFAHEAATTHHSVRLRNPTVPNAAILLRETLREMDPSVTRHPDVPVLIWGGDGGSVGLGGAYLSPVLLSLLLQNQREVAIGRFLLERGATVRRRVLQSRIGTGLEGVLRQGIEEELDGICGRDLAHSFYLFLILNDQRRHLAQHYELIDLSRVEFLLPFFDAEFLAVLCGIPVDRLALHRFYNRWVTRLPSSVLAVPWQAYPGHEPCPVPERADLVKQWDPAYNRIQARLERPRYARIARDLLAARDFPSPILNRGALSAVTLLHRLGFRDYRYLITAAEVYTRYWRRSAGRAALPDGTQLTAPPA